MEKGQAQRLDNGDVAISGDGLLQACIDMRTAALAVLHQFVPQIKTADDKTVMAALALAGKNLTDQMNAMAEIGLAAHQGSTDHAIN